jgi:hypothetical protein
MPKWFYIREEQEFGPLTEKAMRDLIARGRLHGQSMVRPYHELTSDESTPWVTLSASGLAEAFIPEATPRPSLNEDPPAPTELRRTTMPLECTVASALAIAALTVQIIYLLSQLFSGNVLDPLLAAKSSGIQNWALICLAIYVIAVILWQAATSDVPALYGAEVAAYTPSHAVLWLIPGLNIYHAMYAMREIWTFSKDPRAWTRNGVRGNTLTRIWWLALFGAALATLIELTIRRNLGKSLTDGRMNHWQEILAYLSFGRSLLWILHLILFVIIIIQIYRRQASTLKNPPTRRLGRRTEKRKTLPVP